jgi:hypothetical protein
MYVDVSISAVSAKDIDNSRNSLGTPAEYTHS